MGERIIELDASLYSELCSDKDRNIKYINSKFPLLRVVVRGGAIKIIGTPELILRYERKMDELAEYFSRYGHISPRVIDQVFDGSPLGRNSTMGGDRSVEGESGMISSEEHAAEPDHLILFGNNGVPIRAKTKNQQKLVSLYHKNDLFFAIGPAGSGKTYTAIALAVRALKNKEVKKIILTRPAVEAGEKLGFLPGDMKEKLDPYLQPLYDALGDMMPGRKLAELMAEGVIQIAPLAYMRGRTLDNAFVILDEAQNTTREQLKMFLTRMGRSAKFVVTGDLTQIDLPRKADSGLVSSIEILEKIKGIAVVRFDGKDILRHPLVGKIVQAYEAVTAENI